MLRNILTKSLKIFCCFLLVMPIILAPSASYALYDGPRDTDFKGGSCDTGTLDFNPFFFNKDAEWKFDNPICATFIAGVGAIKIGASLYAKYQCIPTNGIGSPKAAAEIAADADFDIPTLSPSDIKKQIMKTTLCSTRTAELGLLTTILANCTAAAAASAGAGAASCALPAQQVTAATADVTKCCSATAGYFLTITSALAALTAIYTPAVLSYKYSRVCGHDWLVWDKVDEEGVHDVNGIWKRGKYVGSYQKCLEDLFSKNRNTCGLPNVVKSITNRYYREYIYGGKEYEDYSSGSCSNPIYDSKDSTKLERLGYTSSNQRYYMTGPNTAPVFACHRFLASNADANSKAAFECCKRRSQEVMCIENAIAEKALNTLSSGSAMVLDRVSSGLSTAMDEMAEVSGNDFSMSSNLQARADDHKFSAESFDHTFCKLGSRCDVAGIIFETYSSKKVPGYICAKTYSVCPYNHLLGGGTEEKEMEGSDGSLVKNFCQYMNHCTKIPIAPYVRTSTFDGAYISSACKDMKGDSQNEYGFTAELVPINTRGFSAPMTQCFRETMENMFLFKAGFTECKNPDEPVRDDICGSGQYRYKKGEDINKYEKSNTESFFLKMQNHLQSAIKVALTFSVMAFGMLVLLGMSPLTKKQLLTYVLKIALIMFFAVGDGWQFGFLRGVFGTANLLSDMTFKLDEARPPEKLDGCQFPRFNYADKNPETKYNHPAYPPGKEYLRTWDILDCKIARALGFGPEVSVPNMVMMILGGFLSGAAGVIFLVATFSFAFFMIALTIRAIHIFLLSTTAVIILLYISPLTITLSIFTRTKPIFDAWWKQILGFSLQPMILFAYLAILITFFDSAIIGDVTFSGDGIAAPKTIHCVGEVADTSIYCIFRISEMKTYNALSPFGIGLPVLTSLNKTKIQTLIKSAILLFILMKFMDQISSFAKTLVGGAELKSDSMSATKMAGKAYSGARSIQKRGKGAIKKHGMSAARGAYGAVKGAFASAGNKGKAVSGAEASKSAVRDQGTSSGNDPKDMADAEKTKDSASQSGSANSPAGGNAPPKPSAPPADSSTKP